MRLLRILSPTFALLLLAPLLFAQSPPPCRFAGAYAEHFDVSPGQKPYFPSSRGKLRGVMFFVDFPDAPQSESTAELYNLVAPRAIRWYQDVSYGRFKLEITRVDKWYRMAKPSEEYGFKSLTQTRHRAYIAEAMALADPDVDFSKYQVVYIVSAKGAQIPLSPTFIADPGEGVTADGAEFRHVVTFGADMRRPIPYGANVLVHETGHMLGLPDLYLYGLNGIENFLRPIGGWDVMSSTLTGSEMMVWDRLRLRWLDDKQVDCMESYGSIERLINPVEKKGGLKAVVVPGSDRKLYVIEVRAAIGEDKTRLCDEGVLIYTVNPELGSGQGTLEVIRSQPGTDVEKIKKCAVAYNATFGLAPDKVSKFEDKTAGVRVELFSKRGLSSNVKVTRFRADDQKSDTEKSAGR